MGGGAVSHESMNPRAERRRVYSRSSCTHLQVGLAVGRGGQAADPGERADLGRRLWGRHAGVRRDAQTDMRRTTGVSDHRCAARHSKGTRALTGTLPLHVKRLTEPEEVAESELMSYAAEHTE